MKKLVLYAIVLLFSVVLQAQDYPFTNEIEAFRKEDKISKPKDGMVLFIGSSSFRLWKDLKTDFTNPNILNRAFGGATFLDLIHFQDAIALQYKPKKILIYCGDNDIASSEKVTPKVVFKRFKTFYKTLRNKFPDTEIAFVSIKPSIARWAMKDRMFQANRLIDNFLYKKKYAVYINVWDAMLENGAPRKDIFLNDNLHMNSKGYAIWIDKLKDFVNN